MESTYRPKMRCPVCRKAFTFSAKHLDKIADCPSCGDRIRLLDQRVEIESAPPKPQLTPAPKDSSPPSINWTWVGIGALAVIALGFSVWALIIVPLGDSNTQTVQTSDPPQQKDSTTDPVDMPAPDDIDTTPASDPVKPEAVSTDDWNGMSLDERFELCKDVLSRLDVDVTAEELVVACGDGEIKEQWDDLEVLIQGFAIMTESLPLAKCEFTGSTDSAPFINGKRRFTYIEWEGSDSMSMSLYDVTTGRIMEANVIMMSGTGKRRLWLDPGAYYMSIDAIGPGKVLIYRSEPVHNQ